jgi:hypothetical protein
VLFFKTILIIDFEAFLKFVFIFVIDPDTEMIYHEKDVIYKESYDIPLTNSMELSTTNCVAI